MLPPYPPKTPAEEQAKRFIQDAQGLAPSAWESICLRYREGQAEISRAHGKMTQFIARHASELMKDKHEVHRHARFMKSLADGIEDHLLSLPEETEHGGAALPLRSLSHAAVKQALRAFGLLSDKLKLDGKEKLFATCLRPFHGHATLPEYDYAAPKQAKHSGPGTPRSIPYAESSGTGAYHFGFPDGYFRYREKVPAHIKIKPLAWNRKDVSHRTWSLDRFTGLQCDFGGEDAGDCPYCREKLGHLVTFPVLAGMPVTGLERCRIVTCTACLGWRTPHLSFRHASPQASEPVRREDADDLAEGGERALIAPAKVSLCATPAESADQDWGGSDGENLHRIGGTPSWVQGEEIPDCADCGKPMAFLLQLDSGLPTRDGRRWLWGSGGMLFVFWCDACKVDSQSWQCT